MEHAFLIGFVGLVILIVLITALAPSSDRSKERHADATARSVGLALHGEIGPAVVRRLLRARRFSTIGSTLGWSLGFAFSVAVSSKDHFAGWAGWLPLGSIVVGGAFGNAVAAIIDGSRRPRSDRPRLARATAVSIDDYVPRYEIVGARAGVAGMLVLVGVVMALGVLPPVAGGGILALGIVSLALLELGGRSIVDQHQSAGSTDELAWDDALRSKNLGTLALAPIWAALYGAMAALFALLAVPGPLQSVATGVIGFLLVAMLIVLIVAGSRRQNRGRYYLRRLWPATAAAGEQEERDARVPS